jgi:alkanesulfonate monooxygenase SsuD/methylene tetrahydromethanopterin reductase-like flavin-dependent oxidoreductase (luciferase family)
MHGSVVGPVSPELEQELLQLHASYDMNRHGRPGRQTDLVSDTLMDTFAIAGDPEYCIRRITEIAALGITHMDIVSGWGVDLATGEVSQPLLTEKVLPGVHAALGD